VDGLAIGRSTPPRPTSTTRTPAGQGAHHRRENGQQCDPASSLQVVNALVKAESISTCLYIPDRIMAWSPRHQHYLQDYFVTSPRRGSADWNKVSLTRSPHLPAEINVGHWQLAPIGNRPLGVFIPRGRSATPTGWHPAADWQPSCHHRASRTDGGKRHRPDTIRPQRCHLAPHIMKSSNVQNIRPLFISIRRDSRRSARCVGAVRAEISGFTRPFEGERRGV